MKRQEREALAGGGGEGGGHCLLFPMVTVQGSCAAASLPASLRVAFSSEQNPMQKGKVTGVVSQRRELAAGEVGSPSLCAGCT